MSKPNPKNQHYVSDCYLKQFKDLELSTKDNPKIWVFPKKSRKGILKKTEKTFRSRHIYTFKSKQGGNHNYSLEISLGVLEDAYVDVFEKKIKHKLPLSQEDHLILCAFVAAMMLRTKRFKKNIENFYDRIIAQIESIEKQHNLPAGESTKYKIFRDNVHKSTLASLLPEITDILFNMNLSFFSISPKSKSVFITSDDPCNLFNSDLQWQNFVGYGLGQKNIQLTMPLSPYIEVCFCWAELRGYIKMSESRVTDHNRMTRGMCDQEFVSSSPQTRLIWFSRYPADIKFIITRVIPNLVKKFIRRSRLLFNVR